MSILTKPYELSVWEDVWENGKFVEKRLGIIGSNEITAQGRAFEPTLTTNVNGEKKLSFKMYKQYTDVITGEVIKNPYSDWLLSERKVKLKYKSEWYDFIIKNISEDSSTHLCTYQLEDALVQELSKNGFGIVLDAELMNNIGTASELAEKVLKETDWEVSSEFFVETIEESLVYLKTTKDLNVKKILDQTDLSKGVGEEDATLPKGSTILAFYSSCTSKPYRFQFIYVGSDSIKKDENRFIINENCQYYYDVGAEAKYTVENTAYNFYLPDGFKTTTVTEFAGANGVTVSGEYRGRRYGFSQKSQFVPVLNRYVNVYKDSSDKEVYGYLNTEYKSPALTQNIITSANFKSASGWTGTKLNSDGLATVETAYVYYQPISDPSVDGMLCDGLTLLTGGTDFKELEKCWPCLKIFFDNGKGCVVNSGPFDNRISLENMEVGDKYALKATLLYEWGDDITDNFDFLLGEYTYNPDTNSYVLDTSKIEFSSAEKEGDSDYYIFTVNESSYSKETFKKNSQVRLAITPREQIDKAYLKDIQLFKVVYDDNGKMITPEEQVEDSTLENRVIENNYYYFNPSDVNPNNINSITSPDQLVPLAREKKLSYSTYKPVFNGDAEKVRTINAKESNYFNILQSIAETFNCWLSLDIERAEDGNGGIAKKSVVFRNYVGKDNYAGFRYGVNLKNIKRTYESKKIVSKLIVKENKNEFAPNGFCTIARAKSNPIGENCIYDFQYYFNTGLLLARSYLDTIYVMNGAKGADINGDPTDTNLQGYFPRIKKINNKIAKLQDLYNNASRDLAVYKAELETAVTGYDAATYGLEQAQESYRKITGVPIGDKASSESTNTFNERSDVKKILTDYLTYATNLNIYGEKKTKYSTLVNKLEIKKANTQSGIRIQLEYKQKLNELFFTQYSRFIQEGTWISEEYVDDEKYYADALSVLYTSCYPQVAYSIDVADLDFQSKYEHFTYQVGDKTFIEDPDFFGEGIRTEIIVTETIENLDDGTKNKIKVQNFKNQFQDLFQRITATVQQAQYNSGSYEKAVALAEANQERKNQFVTDAMMSAEARLMTAGQQSVTWGNDGITVRSVDSPCDAIRMVGGAILLSKQDKNGLQKWVTGVTSDGVSANLITAGVINAGEISIMNYNEPLFRWDAFGLSAFQTGTVEGDFGTVISEIDSTKFVRFDKYGIYGIDEKGGVDGMNWHPENQDVIDEKATFALTWEGLKISGGKDSKVEARIGRLGNNIIDVTKNNNHVFQVTNDGTVNIKGNIKAKAGEIAGFEIGEEGLIYIGQSFTLEEMAPSGTTGHRTAFGFLATYGIGSGHIAADNADNWTINFQILGRLNYRDLLYKFSMAASPDTYAPPDFLNKIGLPRIQRWRELNSEQVAKIILEIIREYKTEKAWTQLDCFSNLTISHVTFVQNELTEQEVTSNETTNETNS